MKSRETLIRLRKFDVDEKRQKVAAIEAMINDFKSMADDLDNQVKSEQQRAGVDDVNHYAYPTFAKETKVEQLYKERIERLRYLFFKIIFLIMYL